MLVSTMAALASAALFAVTTNLQREAASAIPTHGPLHLVRRLLANRLWLASGVVGAAALALHTLALSDGGVMVVQSVMATGLVMALYVEALRQRRRLRPTELAGAALIVGGVALMVAVGTTPGTARASREPAVAVVCGVVVAAVVAAVVASRRAVGSRWGARALAVGGGACFAIDAVFLQRMAAAVGTPLMRGTEPLPELFAAATDALAFLAASVIGGIAVHRAYQVAPLRTVQPAVAAAEPLTAFGVGTALLHEGVRGGAVGYLLLTLALVAITSGIFLGLRAPDDHVPGLGGTTAGPGGAEIPLQHTRPEGRVDLELDVAGLAATAPPVLPVAQRVPGSTRVPLR